MNSSIVHTLRTSLQFRTKRYTNKDEELGQSQDQGQKIKSTEKQIYIILLLITFMFLILTTPAYLFFIINLVVNFQTSPKFFAGCYLYFNIAQKLHVTNYGINFFLYVISGEKVQVRFIEIVWH